MTLWRALTVRVLVASVVCGLVGLASAMVITRAVVREQVVRAFAPLTLGGFHTHEQTVCEEAPERWTITLPSGGRAYAYDADTLTSRNPDAPPLDRGLYRELQATTDPPMVADTRWPLRGGSFLLRVAPSGPCAIVQTVIAPRGVRTRIINVLLVGALVVIMLTAALGFVFVTRPLRTSLGRQLTDVTHDLRTPLSSLRIALEQAADASGEPEVQQLLASALRDAVYLGALTDNLRMASRLREGWDPFARGAKVDVAEAAARVVARARFFARRRGIELDVAVPDEPVPARCDAVAAEQAIANVVDNAVAYGDRGGHVALVLERKDGGFTLSVVDDGPGVPPAALPRLGERTFRTDEARQRDPRGSGLGLAITSEVCTRCGWRLTFDTVEPRGLRVTMSGPLA